MSRAGLCLVGLLLIPVGLVSQQVVPIQGGALPDGTQGTGSPQAGRGLAPPLRTGTARISGRVLTSTGQPLRQATVNISAPELNGSKTIVTDQDGRYEASNLPAGRYSVGARKANYITLNYGQTRPNEIARPVVLANNQHADRIDLTLPRGGVIAGRILDEFGEPVTDAQVMALQKRMPQGQLRLVNAGRTATTNDIGEFRLFGLPPGQYYVSSTLRSVTTGPAENTDNRSGYAPTYYPGTAVAANAQPITVGLSETTSGIDASTHDREARDDRGINHGQPGAAAGARQRIRHGPQRQHHRRFRWWNHPSGRHVPDPTPAGGRVPAPRLRATATAATPHTRAAGSAGQEHRPCRRQPPIPSGSPHGRSERKRRGHQRRSAHAAEAPQDLGTHHVRSGGQRYPRRDREKLDGSTQPGATEP